MYAGDGVLGRAMESFYEKSKARVRVCRGRKEFRCDSGIEARVGDVVMAV